MAMSSKRWKEYTRSKFPWEQEALDFVRERLPDHEPFRAWPNFEFIADDGTINEVDLLVLTRRGFFLVEIKSGPGTLQGDVATWTWKHEGKRYTRDNPSFLANSKAKKLASLLKRQKACSKIRLPYLDVLIFCSAPDLQCLLEGTARYRVCLRDKDATDQRPARPGIISALLDRNVEGIDQNKRMRIDGPVARAISRAMEEAGVCQSGRMRRVGDYQLGKLLAEGPGFQDYEATHSSIDTIKRRARLYLVAQRTSVESRETITRAAKREFQVLEGINHPSILRAVEYKEHELGAALIFERDPRAMRLDHFLVEYSDKLDDDMRIGILREIAEAIKYAHEKKVVHRALSPQSILVQDPTASKIRIQVFNWQTGYRDSGTTAGLTRSVTATQHLDELVEQASQVYMAPEALTDTSSTGEHLDIFSLGAIAYHLFANCPPASSFYELTEKLKEGEGLRISSVLDGAPPNLENFIRYCTHPNILSRHESVSDVLVALEEVEDELTAPDRGDVQSPLEAKPKDVIEGGFLVKSILGRGACSRVLLVERDGNDHVMKVALDLEHNDRLRGESEVLEKIRHQNIVDLHATVEIDGLVCLLMRRAGDKTLADRLRSEGQLHLDLLERFGEDLIQTVGYLEQEGIPHRDIKPDNIGVSPLGRGDKLRLMIFDFSLSRTSADNIRAGTPPYLDPFLVNRKPRRWDLYAERFAVAMTLYEMATGTLPKWGDGKSDPALLNCEVSLEGDRFDPNLRDSMIAFFEQALHSKVEQRFDNCDEMLRAWRRVFENVDQPSGGTDLGEELDLEVALRNVTGETQVAEIGLSTRAMNVLDRLDIITIRDLLRVPLNRIYKARGVGNKTRREIGDLVREIRNLLPDVEPQPADVPELDSTDKAEDDESQVLGVDLLVKSILGRKPAGKVQTAWNTVCMFLGINGSAGEALPCWPSQVYVAGQFEVTRQRIGQIVTNAIKRWQKLSSITVLRNEIAGILSRNGGVMTAEELSNAVLAVRGSTQDEPLRSVYGSAVTRAAVEVERVLSNPRFVVRRCEEQVFIAETMELADYAERLGKKADELATLDPLAPPIRVVETLQKIKPSDESIGLSPSRLVKLAAAASRTAAVSSRQEIYPRGMEAVRAVKLAHGALLGSRQLTVKQVQDRVTGRYPEAEPLPDRPQLDDLLREAGWEFTWDGNAADGKGAFCRSTRELPSITTGSTIVTRLPVRREPAEEITPEVADARQFDERLQHGIKDGAFLALTVRPSRLERTREELLRRFDLDCRSFDEVLIRNLKKKASEIGASWDIVVQSDVADSNSKDWDNLNRLVRKTIPDVERELLRADKTILLTNPGLLARYGQLELLERLRDKVGRPDGIPGLWVLIPADEQNVLPVIDGEAVAVITRGQWARVPDAWIGNRKT